eukprot:2930311-Pleurochrysis_carterae.AAC.1
MATNSMLVNHVDLKVAQPILHFGLQSVLIWQTHCDHCRKGNVSRYVDWCPFGLALSLGCGKKRVLVQQYKLSLADKATFEQDEWGPSEYKNVDYTDEATGTTSQVQSPLKFSLVGEEVYRRRRQHDAQLPRDAGESWSGGLAASKQVVNEPIV